MSKTNPLPQTDHPIRLCAAFRALWRLALDNDDTTQVFKIVDALRGRSDLRNVERMRESEIGRAILAERGCAVCRRDHSVASISRSWSARG
ncbi:MAG: hypothetical protein E6J87_12195 [Deltaproteobacteria bacterium]|nr:MAG: hypothetical protein E6J87_12195 [Deltaproteobacteria bacterium]